MSKYNDFINNIIIEFGQHRKDLPNPESIVYERHHIKPRCIGGTDDMYNLVDLTLREHYIAHMLLAEENPEEEKLVCAWHFMSTIKDGIYQATPEEYEASRLAIIKAQGEAVYQLDKEGKVIACYHSAREAGRQVGTSYTHIIECCNKERHRAKGYFWQTVKDYAENGFSHKAFMEEKPPVMQYDLNGNFIASYESFADAARAMGVTAPSIRHCCIGKTKTCKGYIWRKGQYESI